MVAFDWPTIPLDMDTQRWIAWMDNQCFPYEVPVSILGADWLIGRESGNPVCYAAWKAHYILGGYEPPKYVDVYGYHLRAGVLPSYRGNGLQREMLTLRECLMRNLGICTAITYTEPTSIASMKTLISCGYTPYLAKEGMVLCGAGREDRMVHWRKEL